MKENVFGIPMNVQRRADIENQEIGFYVVMRAADAPLHTYPPQIGRRMIPVACQKCREMCYRDSRNSLVGAVVVCMRCMPPITDDTESFASQEDVDEIRLLQRERFGL